MTPDHEPEHLPDEAALADITALLAGLPRPTIPPEVSARIAAALAAESVTPGHVGASARPRRRNFLALAAALVVIAGGVGISQLHRNTPTTTAAMASAADLSAVASALEPQLRQLKSTASAPMAASSSSLGYGAAQGGAATPAPGAVGGAPPSPMATAGLSSADLNSCLTALGRSGQTPSLVSQVQFGSGPALAIAFLSQDGSAADVLIVAPTCRSGAPGLLGRTTVLLPNG